MHAGETFLLKHPLAPPVRSPWLPAQVWDFYLYWGDPALHHFVVLAFVIGNAEVILKVTLRFFFRFFFGLGSSV